MKHILETMQKDGIAKIGLIFLLVSLSSFVGTWNIYALDFDIFTGIFFVTFGITWIYAIAVGINNMKLYGQFFRYRNFTHNMILLQLFNVSAYTLNRTIPVFNESSQWLVVFLTLTNGLLILHSLRKQYNSTPLSYAILAASSLSILFHIYQSVYVSMLYPIAFIGFFFFGISLHALVPILFSIAHLIIIRRFLKKSSRFWATTAISFAFAFLMITYFSVRFHQINQTISANFHEELQPYQDNQLPSWVSVSQKLPKDWITERALKAGLVYTEADNLFEGGWMGDFQLNERQKHDPLVVMATFFSSPVQMEDKDKVNILRYMFDARHQTERKLWSGDNLSTTEIVTNVQLFPDYRLAYTEKTFKIKNTQVERWGSQQEALYTFYLPEGSVVTSAALWINGEESPAFLTTKGKADSAYTTIVGRERRDPLLLHWQEGNRVTVRVFPCTPDEDRQFKIGVTTPLRTENEKLLYENIDFEGPYWKNATESINVVSEGELSQFSAPYSFKKEGLTYHYKGKYKSDWSLKFAANELSNTAFAYNGQAFNIQNLETKNQKFAPKTVYLDINAGWTKKEFNNIFSAIGKKKIMAYAGNRMVELTENNKSDIFKDLKRQNFTLFPFYKMQSGEKSLVITKFNQLTPTLDDLKESEFLKSTSAFFESDSSSLRVFNIGNRISPYMKTLKEIRAIQLEDLPANDIAQLIENQKFPANQENENTIVNDYADFKIIKDEYVPGNKKALTKAPNHLMRLFAYNGVLKAVGKNYFNKKYLEDELQSIAEKAYVVTPVSSLIVLETQADYDRFDIKKSKDSLGNASITDSGSVPEPHEWLLILLVLGITMFLYFKRV